MANPNITREQLVYRVGLQIFLTLMAVVFTVVYTLPKLEAISEQNAETNAAIENYNSITNNGIPQTQLLSTINRIGNNSELAEIITRAGDKISTIITKQSTKPYLEWLKEEALKDDADRAALADAQAKINSIIPTLSPMSNNRNAESVTLREYITFIEQEILAKFNIESLAPLGIDGVKYEETEDGALSNPVGTFTVEMNFKTTNENIVKLLDFIKNSGDPAILSDSQILPNPPAVMSNPLITIESLALNEMLNASAPTSENSGRIILKFYVRGSSMTDANYLIEAFNKRKNALNEEINAKVTSCEKDMCAALESYKKVQKKFAQFNKSLETILTNTQGKTIETVYIVGQQLQSLQAIRQEFENIK